MFDLVVTGGDVIDGTGTPRIRGDVAVKDGRIAAIGDLASAESLRRIDATGKCVAPGFIDVHNHSDGWMLRQPRLDPKTRQGFTTEVLAADGISYAPVDAQTASQWVCYLRSLNALRMDQYRGWQSLEEMMLTIDGNHVQNAATHIPYANVRTLACGWGEAPADDFQMREIQHHIEVGMDAGAVGLSTGIDYISQCFCDTDELVRACTAMSRYRGLYVTHIRYKASLLKGLEEAFDIGRRADVPVHISHLKAFDQQITEPVLDSIERARRDVDLSFDVYPYQPGSTMLHYLLPYDVWEDGPLAALHRLQQPAIRDRFRRGLESQRLNLDRIRLAWLPSRENFHHLGKSLRQYVEFVGGDAADVLSDLLLEEHLAVLCVMDEGDDALVRPFLQHDLYMMGTDGIYHEDGWIHPRMFGSAGRLLGPCVRDLQLFSLEEAVKKMTSWPARRFGLPDRGLIAEGKWADLAVFDPDTVTDHATYDEPLQCTTGITHVVVAGEVIVEDEQCLTPATLPGRFIRASHVE